MEHKVPVSVASVPAASSVQQAKVLKLPTQVLTQVDVSRLSREIESLETFFTQASIKAADAKTLPQLTQHLNLVVEENSLNLLVKEDRAALKDFFAYLRAKAPVVHTIFATDPKPDFLVKLATWFRTEAHPHVLLQTGLQPNIAAGCIIRTTNKYFDFSFQQHFKESKMKLIQAMRATE